MKTRVWLIAALLILASAQAEGREFSPEAAQASSSAFAVPGGYLLGAGIFALIVAMIVVGAMISKLKTARSQAAAESYVRPDSFDLRVRQDYFLYQTVQKRKIETKKEQ